VAAAGRIAQPALYVLAFVFRQCGTTLGVLFVSTVGLILGAVCRWLAASAALGVPLVAEHVET